MAHRTRINGTAYDVVGGRTLVNGTGYSIKGGKTKVNGTGYSIKFSHLPTLAELLSTATVEDIAGRNSSSKAAVSVTISNSVATRYLLSFCSNSMSINKRPSGGGLTKLCGNSDSGGNLRRSGTTYAYCSTAGGSSSTTVYGASIVVVSFDSSPYDEETIDTVLSGVSFTGETAGRNTSSTAVVSLSVSDDASKVVFAAMRDAFAAFVNGSSVLQHTNVPPVTAGSGSHTYYAGTSTTQKVYGGSIIVCQ